MAENEKPQRPEKGEPIGKPDEEDFSFGYLSSEARSAYQSVLDQLREEFSGTTPSDEQINERIADYLSYLSPQITAALTPFEVKMRADLQKVLLKESDDGKTEDLVEPSETEPEELEKWEKELSNPSPKDENEAESPTEEQKEPQNPNGPEGTNESEKWVEEQKKLLKNELRIFKAKLELDPKWVARKSNLSETEQEKLLNQFLDIVAPFYNVVIIKLVESADAQIVKNWRNEILAMRDSFLEEIKQSSNNSSAEKIEEAETPTSWVTQQRKLLDDVFSKETVDLSVKGINLKNIPQREKDLIRGEVISLLKNFVFVADERKKQFPLEQVYADWYDEIFKSRDAFFSSLQIDLKQEESDPLNMDIYEITRHLTEAAIPADRTLALKQAFIEKIGGVKDLQERMYLKTQVVLQAILAQGDTGENDFGVWFNQINKQYITNGVNYIDVVRALFLKRSVNGRRLSEDELVGLGFDGTIDVDSLDIDDEALEMVAYILDRIKGKYGGKGIDRADSADADFSYQVLSNDRADQFRSFLKKKFAPRFSEKNEGFVSELIKFSQANDVKSSAYAAWMARETTRSHGAGSKNIMSEKLIDALFVSAPYAAGIYSRGRYGDIIPNATSSDLVFMNRDVAMDIVPDKKKDSAKALWSIVNEYFVTMYWGGKLPKFVRDFRELVGIDNSNKPLDLYKTWFPLPFDLIVDSVQKEKKKRDLLKEFSTNSSDQNIKNDLDSFIKLCYNEGQIAKFVFNDGNGNQFNVLNAIQEEDVEKVRIALQDVGLGKLKTLTVSNYDVAFDAVQMMNDKFYHPNERLKESEECVTEFKDWMDKVIGKAKLIPGKHQLMFPAYTMRAMVKIIAGYKSNSNGADVQSLVDIMKTELLSAGGVPEIVKERVSEYIDQDRSCFGVYATLDSGKYRKHLFEYKERVALSMQQLVPMMKKVLNTLFLGFTTTDRDGKPLSPSQPWSWGIQADKNTSNK